MNATLHHDSDPAGYMYVRGSEARREGEPVTVTLPWGENATVKVSVRRENGDWTVKSIDQMRLMDLLRSRLTPLENVIAMRPFEKFADVHGNECRDDGAAIVLRLLGSVYEVTPEAAGRQFDDMNRSGYAERDDAREKFIAGSMAELRPLARGARFVHFNRDSIAHGVTGESREEVVRRVAALLVWAGDDFSLGRQPMLLGPNVWMGAGGDIHDPE